MADRSGEMAFPTASPGEASSIGRAYYGIFECGTFSRPSYIRDKFYQVEQHLTYLVEHQKRKQNKEVVVTDIVAVAGVVSVFPWPSFKKTLGGLGQLDHVKYPNCNRLAKYGRLLTIYVEDPMRKTYENDLAIKQGISILVLALTCYSQ